MARQSVTAELPFHRLLRNNDLGIIENPLRRVHEDDLIADIRNFHHEYSLKDIVDVDVLIRGGLLARDEEATVTEGRLSDVEVSALEREKSTRIWDESKELKVILLTCCVGSVVQGWAQGAIVGANQLWPAEFGLIIGLTGPKEPEGHMNDIWRFSATNAIVYFAASSIGALLCDPLTEIFMGRRGALFVAAIMTFTASIGEGFTHSWQVGNSRLLFIFLCTIIAENAGVNVEALFACRFLLGIGMGAKSSIIPVLESEISPARLRGQILTSWQTGTALGIAISAIVPLIVTGSWRFTIASSFIPAAMLLALVFVGSESPRWLAKKQRYSDAYKVLQRLRESPVLAARDLIRIRAQLDVETILFTRNANDVIELGNELPHLDAQAYRREISLAGYGRRIIQLFTIPRVRRSTLASFIVMSAQQLSGVNVFAFLASTLFEFAGISHKRSLWLFFGFGLANFVFSAIAYFYIDSKGRRFLLMLSLAAMFPLLLASGFAFKASSTNVENALVATFLVLYTLAYSPGAGVVPFLYSSEIFPQVLREVGMAWASAVCWMGAGILALTVPRLIHGLGQTALLCLFAGLDAFALLMVWLLVPGTERQISTMEEMNYVFGVTTKKHMHYQLKEVAPWYYSRYVRRQRVEDLAPLYRYAKLKDTAAEEQ